MRTSGDIWNKFDDYVIDFALNRMRKDERIALITLVKIEGSSPRPLGAQMAVSEVGDWVGYLSGGCIERVVVAEALAAIRLGSNRRVRYGQGSKYFDINLPCGSAIELVFDVGADEDDLQAVDLSLKHRKPASLQVPGNFEGYPDEVLIRHYYPRRRLIVAGVGPSALYLAKLGQLSGFECVIFSPDETTRSTAEAEEIRAVAITNVHAVPDFEADKRSAIVFMFHDHAWERTLIPAVLDTEAFYIGAMGSRRTHRQRLEMLESQGVDSIRLSRIRGPAGLFSGAKTGPDIAMSILAEIMQIERSANTKILSSKSRSSELPFQQKTSFHGSTRWLNQKLSDHNRK